MEIDFKISKDELIDFNMKYIVGTKTYKQEIRAYAIFAFFVIIGMIFLLRSTLYTVTGVIMYIIFSFSKKRIYNRALRKRFLKTYETDKLADVFETTHLKFIEKGLKTNTKFSEKIHNWNAIKGLYLLEQYVFIPTMNGESLVIPILAFESVDQKKLFLDTIIKNTNLELEYSYPDSV